jgi:hypothetical protein
VIIVTKWVLAAQELAGGVFPVFSTWNLEEATA